jgi:hypothetical protein
MPGNANGDGVPPGAYSDGSDVLSRTMTGVG